MKFNKKIIGLALLLSLKQSIYNARTIGFGDYWPDLSGLRRLYDTSTETISELYGNRIIYEMQEIMKLIIKKNDDEIYRCALQNNRDFLSLEKRHRLLLEEECKEKIIKFNNKTQFYNYIDSSKNISDELKNEIYKIKEKNPVLLEKFIDDVFYQINNR
jgi:hypothetical protein